MPRQPASQRIHTGRECGPGVLCKKTSIHYTHPVEWEDNLMQMLKQATNMATSSCICKACGDDFKRNNSKPQYTPRWVKPHSVCCTCVQMSRSSNCIQNSGQALHTKHAKYLHHERRRDNAVSIPLPCSIQVLTRESRSVQPYKVHHL